MADPSDEDDLTKRFKAIFNKDPVSHSSEHQKWTISHGTYEIDDEEVPNSAVSLGAKVRVREISGGKLCFG